MERNEAIDPVCAIHGRRASEHECIYCCICFASLTPEQCFVDDEGHKWDVCAVGDCARQAGVDPLPGEKP